MRFLGTGPYDRPQAVILGAPYDATGTNRRGSRLGPAAIRYASDSLETYSPFQARDLVDLAVTDAGDLDLAGLDPEVMVGRVGEAVSSVSGLPVVLGGEHTVTIGAVMTLTHRHPDLAVVVLDAHLDLVDDYEGQRWSHAAVFRRIGERIGYDRIVMLGARSGTRAEWELSRSFAHCGHTGAVPTEVWQALGDRPLYLSVDIDGFDPSLAPGTGNLEPLGLSVDDFAAVLSLLRERRVVGCDLVEVSPPFDPSAQSAMLAAWIVREMLLAFVR